MVCLRLVNCVDNINVYNVGPIIPLALIAGSTITENRSKKEFATSLARGLHIQPQVLLFVFVPSKFLSPPDAQLAKSKTNSITPFIGSVVIPLITYVEYEFTKLGEETCHAPIHITRDLALLVKSFSSSLSPLNNPNSIYVFSIELVAIYSPTLSAQ
jgi:hypothetical protein